MTVIERLRPSLSHGWLGSLELITRRSFLPLIAGNPEFSREHTNHTVLHHRGPARWAPVKNSLADNSMGL